MENMTGIIESGITPYCEFKNHVGEVVTIKGAVHSIRDMSDFAFIIIRTARELIQCVYCPDFSDYRMDDKLVEQCSVRLWGKVVKSETRDGSERYELQVHGIDVLSVPAAIPPVVINKKQVNADLSVNLDYRPVTLRNPKERAVFKIQEGIQRGFREYLTQQGFTEIHSPKINFAGAEGGTNVFKLDYFGKTVYLAQSPQLYKQALVPVYER
ncbi:MAG: aspartate--tRNA(Asn) ligase, partial [Clostridia bacterium]|nr:aspartate--tRNA(Asn) ligase [Clostridia bacterium]